MQAEKNLSSILKAHQIKHKRPLDSGRVIKLGYDIEKNKL